MKKRVTLVDIAKRTGFSVNCVSRALMDARDISDNTKNIIKEVADELGYVPNLSAVSLKKGNSKIIGVLYDNLLNPYYNTIIYYLEKILSSHNYSIITYSSEKFDEDIYKEIISRNVEGLISFLIPEDDVVKKLKKFSFPAVVIGRKSDYISSVYYDDIKVGYLAGNILLEKGYKKPLYLGEIETLDISKKRAEGFLKALNEKNIEGKIIYRQHHDNFSELIKRVICDIYQDVDSIFCFSDFVAFEVIKELRKIKRDDIKVIGVDNIQKEISLPFNLTTIGQDKDKIASDAINLLFDQILKRSSEAIKEIVEDVYLVDELC